MEKDIYKPTFPKYEETRWICECGAGNDEVKRRCTECNKSRIKNIYRS